MVKRSICVVIVVCSMVFSIVLVEENEASICDSDIQLTWKQSEKIDSLWDYDHYQESEKRFSARLKDQDCQKDHDLRAEVLTQLARSLAHQGKRQQALKRLNESRELIKDKDHVAYVRYLLERGRVHLFSMEYDQASKFFIESYERGKKQHYDFYAVDAAHMMLFPLMATTSVVLGNIKENEKKMLNWTNKGLRLANQTADKRTKDWIPVLYRNMASYYLDRSNDLGKAVTLYDDFLKWNEDNGYVNYKYIVERAQIVQEMGEEKTLPQSMRHYLNSGGAIVTQVIVGSQAEKIGLKIGDVVISFAGQNIKTKEDLINKVKVNEIDQVILVVQRLDKKLSFQVSQGPLGIYLY